MKKIIAIILLCSTCINAQTICDSISYNIGSGQELILTGVNSSSDSVNFMWGVCYNQICVSASGDTVVFDDVDMFDTVKVCLNISPQWLCDECQDLVFTNGSWQLVNPITCINEIQPIIHDNKIYDVLGNELRYIPIGKIYIQNNRSYLRILLK